jgi:hypothetical protein
MKKMLGQFSAQSVEDDDTRTKLKMSQYIVDMDAELKDRFKALKAIQENIHDLDEEEQKGIRQLEIEFEEKYKDIYKLREQFINSKLDLDQELIKEFDQRAATMKDAEYDKLEVVPCDVKSIQNSPTGVSDFWVKSLLNHPIGSGISEKDRPILGYLQNIELELHPEEVGEGFDLIFTFAENSYFTGTILRKELHMKSKGVLDKTISTVI